MKTLQVNQVKTVMKGNVLLDDITFSIDAGTVMALVGHNGAGKSTLMKTILGELEKETGTITVNQYDQDRHYTMFKQHIAYLPEEPLLLTELTVMQHFQLYGISYGLAEQKLMK